MDSTTTNINHDAIRDFIEDSYLGDDYLEHYGREGMKWYQHIFGEKDSRAKYSDKGASDANISTSKKAQKAYRKEAAKVAKQKQKAKEEAAKKKEEEQKAEEKKKRERIENLRDPGRLKQHQYEYTADEVREALDRFNWEQQLHNYNQQKLKRGADYMQTFVKYATSTIAMYNIGANVYNAFNTNNKVAPLVPTGTVKPKEKEQKPKPKDKK